MNINTENNHDENNLPEPNEELQNFLAVINRIGTRLAVENDDLHTFDTVSIHTVE